MFLMSVIIFLSNNFNYKMLWYRCLPNDVPVFNASENTNAQGSEYRGLMPRKHTAMRKRKLKMRCAHNSGLQGEDVNYSVCENVG
jgi:hypothetical protein